MWNGLNLEASCFIFFGANVHLVQIFFLHQLIVQHTFDLCPYIHSIANYILIFTNIICINITLVHPHNNQDIEHHLHQDSSSLAYNSGAKAE
jgi:hypothetical protein